MGRWKQGALVTVLCLGACVTTDVVRGPEYETYRRETYYRRQARAPSVLPATPDRPFVVVGTVKLRTSRVTDAKQLRRELSFAAVRLDADAVIPPSTPGAEVQASDDALRPFYLSDDGRSQVLEARAIRFPPSAEERAAIERSVPTGPVGPASLR